jgi:hypothetical protein
VLSQHLIANRSLQRRRHRPGSLASADDGDAPDAIKWNSLIPGPQSVAVDVHKFRDKAIRVNGLNARAPNLQGVVSKLVGVAQH